MVTPKGYSFAEKKKVAITHDIVTKEYILPMGNTVTIICGKSKKQNIVCTIISNKKEPKKTPIKSKKKAK